MNDQSSGKSEGTFWYDLPIPGGKVNLGGPEEALARLQQLRTETDEGTRERNLIDGTIQSVTASMNGWIETAPGIFSREVPVSQRSVDPDFYLEEVRPQLSPAMQEICDERFLET